MNHERVGAEGGIVLAGLLIIDDELESRQEIRLAIEESPYQYLSVYESDSGENGLFLLKQNRPSILILDISLPDMDGIEVGKKALELNPRIAVIVLTHLKMFELAQAAINAGFARYFLKPLNKMELISSLEKLLNADLIRETQELRKTTSGSEDVEIDLGNPIQSAVRFIQKHYHEPIKLNDVADGVYLSASHFSRLFKAEMGMTFIEYLTKYRVEQSKKLLKMTLLPIEVIASNTGFANASYFSTTFKRLEGKTPTEYRNLFSNFLWGNGSLLRKTGSNAVKLSKKTKTGSK